MGLIILESPHLKGWNPQIFPERPLRFSSRLLGSGESVENINQSLGNAEASTYGPEKRLVKKKSSWMLWLWKQNSWWVDQHTSMASEQIPNFRAYGIIKTLKGIPNHQLLVKGLGYVPWVCWKNLRLEGPIFHFRPCCWEQKKTPCIIYIDRNPPRWVS